MPHTQAHGGATALVESAIKLLLQPSAANMAAVEPLLRSAIDAARHGDWGESGAPHFRQTLRTCSKLLHNAGAARLSAAALFYDGYGKSAVVAVARPAALNVEA